jgi:thermitase
MRSHKPNALASQWWNESWLARYTLLLFMVLCLLMATGLSSGRSYAAVQPLPVGEADPNSAGTEGAIDRVVAPPDDGVRKDKDNDKDEYEFEGKVVARPASRTGEWLVQLNFEVTRLVHVDSSTEFKTGKHNDIFEGDWVEVEGIVHSDDLFVATKISLEEYKAQEIIVRLQSGVISDTVATRYQLIPKSTLLATAGIYLFGTTAGDEQKIADSVSQDPDVIWAEVNYVHTAPEGNGFKTWAWGGTDASRYTNSQVWQQVNLEPAAALYRGNGTKVAVLDTGVALEHPTLKDRLAPGLNVVEDGVLPDDQGVGLLRGHGTHIAGIIAHIAPEATIIPVRVLDANGRGSSFLLAYAIEWAAAQGADVVNLSLGTSYDSHILRDVISGVEASGVVVVAAAGNHGSTELQYPAAYPNVVSVTAVDANGMKADFANYGADWIDLAAPGTGITSTMVYTDGTLGYASWAGTSTAAAFVSGTAALAREKWPAADASLSAQEILRILVEHGDEPADEPEALHAGEIGRLLNIGAALVSAMDHQLFFPLSLNIEGVLQ